MANFDLYFPTLLKHEGGYVNDPKDKGGATNLGVTLKVWVANGWDKNNDGLINYKDIQLLTPADAKYIAKTLYWDKIAGDLIKSQSIAEFIFDWAYNSGPVTAAKKLQRVIGVDDDGKIGNNTLKKLNSLPAKEVFEKLKLNRAAFFHAIVKNNPSQAKFLKGWLNRNNSFIFKN